MEKAKTIYSIETKKYSYYIDSFSKDDINNEYMVSKDEHELCSFANYERALMFLVERIIVDYKIA